MKYIRLDADDSRVTIDRVTGIIKLVDTTPTGQVGQPVIINYTLTVPVPIAPKVAQWKRERGLGRFRR